MVELGIYGIARVYWTVFAFPLAPHHAAVGGILLATGSLSAVLGAVITGMCCAAAHQAAARLFDHQPHGDAADRGRTDGCPRALAGAAVYTVAHGLVKGALFLLAGILLHSLGSVDELELRGAGRRLPFTAIAFGLGAVGLAGMPPFGTGLWGSR